MYLSMIIAAAIMFSFQFVFNDGFRKEAGSDLNASLKFTLYSSVTGMILLIFLNKFHLEFSVFSLLTACVYSIVFILLSYASIKAFEHANLSVYSVFLMVGGMVLPFLYGLLLGEEFRLTRLVCCILIAICVTMSIKKGAQSKKAIKYYILVFLLNGLVGVIATFHQSYTDICVDSGSFMIFTKIAAIAFSIFLLCLQKERSFSVNKKALFYSGMYSVLSSTANLLLLIALLHLPASLQYPVVTGGVIVISTLIVIIRKEHITKREIWAAVIAFVSTALMAL